MGNPGTVPAMQFSDPLIPGTLIKRYKRFLADVDLGAKGVVTAHCPNPGSMMGLAEPGSAVWLSPANNPNRKLQFTLELVETPTSVVGVNTAWPNRIVAEAIETGAIARLSGYQSLRREVGYGASSRIDLLLEDSARPACYVEIKSVTLKRDRARGGLAEFPDAVTKRGAKHLGELSLMVKTGARAVLFYLVQREDCARVAVAADVDPVYDKAFRAALAQGVEALAYGCDLSTTGIKIADPLPIAV